MGGMVHHLDGELFGTIGRGFIGVEIWHVGMDHMGLSIVLSPWRITTDQLSINRVYWIPHII